MSTFLIQFNFRLLEICLALNFADYRWSRAVCIDEHHEEKALIHFIDTGRVDRISYMDLKQLPPEFTFDFVSASCCINGKHFLNKKFI